MNVQVCRESSLFGVKHKSSLLNRFFNVFVNTFNLFHCLNYLPDNYLILMLVKIKPNFVFSPWVFVNLYSALHLKYARFNEQCFLKSTNNHDSRHLQTQVLTCVNSQSYFRSRSIIHIRIYWPKNHSKCTIDVRGFQNLLRHRNTNAD